MKFRLAGLMVKRDKETRGTPDITLNSFPVSLCYNSPDAPFTDLEFSGKCSSRTINWFPFISNSTNIRFDKDVSRRFFAFH